MTPHHDGFGRHGRNGQTAKCETMTTKNVRLSRANEEKNSAVEMPLFSATTYKQVVSAKTLDEARAICREAKPLNTLNDKHVGIFKTSVALTGYTDISGITANVVTFDGEDGYVSENAKIRGVARDNLFVALKAGEGEKRTLSKANSYIFKIAE